MAATSPSTSPSLSPSPSTATVKSSLIKLGLKTCRGERATMNEKEQLKVLVNQLKEGADVEAMREMSCEGTWDLVMSNTQLFRSSPFFMAARAVVSDGDEADRFNWFCDQHRAALDFSQIGRVRQVVTEDKLRSEFEVVAGFTLLAAGLPATVTGKIVSTADILRSKTSERALAPDEVDAWDVAMRSVQVEDSNIPFLKPALDSWLQLPIEPITQALENTPVDVKTWRPTPTFRTLYLDEELRVSVDQDENVFVYSREA